MRTFLLGKSFFEILMEYLKIPCCVQAGNLRDNNIAKSKLSKKGAISVANLRLPADSIVISEKNKKLHIKINLNAKLERHKDCYDEEYNLTERMFIA